MLIDPHSLPLQQWKQKQHLLNKLYEIANLPITADPQQREQLQQELNQFINDQTFDSLFGGLLIKKDNLYVKPLITNLYLIEILVAAGRVFYQGALLSISRLISQNMYYLLSKNEFKLIKYNEYFELEQLACFFIKKEIEQLLDKKEQQLLISLIEGVPNSDNYLIAYRRSLICAAENMNIHYKEAQILEFELQNKLKKHCKKERAKKQEGLENLFDLNCNIITSLVSLMLIEENKMLLFASKKNFHSLYQFVEKKLCTANEVINLLYSGVLLLQVDFDFLPQIVDLINILSDRQNSEKKNEKIRMQLAVIDVFIKTLVKKNIVPPMENLSDMLSGFSESDSNQVECIFLPKEQINLDAQLTQIKSKFNPYQLVFVV